VRPAMAWGAAVVSLALNGWLLASLVHPSRTGAGSAVRLDDRASLQPVLGADASRRGDTGPSASVSAFPPGDCRDQLASLERRVEVTQAMIDESRPGVTAYHPGLPRNGGLESEVKAQLRIPLDMSVECHASACRVSSSDRQALGQLEHDVIGSDWGRRNLDRVDPEFGTLFFSRRLSAGADGFDVLLGMVDGLLQESDSAGCCEGLADGTLSVRLEVLAITNPANGGEEPIVAYTPSGSLVTSRAAECVVRSVQKVIDRDGVPVDVSSAVFEAVGVWPPSARAAFLERVADLRPAHP
jgi:hypothetical protein